jgi:alkylation response protein AidB-like acyl-CoA dehydrogenase
MDFSLTEEQQLLKDSVDRFVRENYEFESRRKIADSNDGYGEDNWKQMAELGWLAVALPEEFGGIGGGGTETMVIMEGFGRGLVLEPFFATVVLGANLIMQGGSDAQKEELLPKLAEGGLKLAFAYAERQARFDLHDVETKAEKSGDGYTITGAKGVVFGAAAADKIIVTARTSGDSRDTNGITLFLVDSGASGVSRRDYTTNDALRASEIEFAGVSMAYVATAMMDSDDAEERARSIAAAKAQIGKSARFVGQNSIQMHGGMGMTDELKVGHYFKRLTMIDLTFGDQDHHTKRFAAMT